MGESKQTLFCGVRTDKGCRVMVEYPEGYSEELDPRYDVRNHSPTGFEWCYAGSGPAQLALALCVHVMGRSHGLEIYQQFKEQVVLGLDRAGWTLTSADIHATCIRLLTEKRIRTGEES